MLALSCDYSYYFFDDPMISFVGFSFLVEPLSRLSSVWVLSLLMQCTHCWQPPFSFLAFIIISILRITKAKFLVQIFLLNSRPTDFSLTIYAYKYFRKLKCNMSKIEHKFSSLTCSSPSVPFLHGRLQYNKKINIWYLSPVPSIQILELLKSPQ